MAEYTPQPIRVLHVDDDPDFAGLTATYLEREDDRFTIETANSADDGLTIIENRKPDCIVSDYNMPKMDGIEFLKTVRERYPDLPFILFTGKGSEQVASDAIAAGVTDYLQKGSNSEQYELLSNRIENAVHARRNAKKATRQEELMRLTEFAGDTGGFELSVDDDYLLLTEGARHLVDLPDEYDLSADDAPELYHPEEREDVQATFNRALETGNTTQGTWRLQTTDDEERLADVTITPVTTPTGETVLRGSIHEITDRRKRQQELKQIETLFQHAQDSLFLINVTEDFAIERVNPAYEEATGQSAEQIRGQKPRELLGEQQGAAAEAKYRKCVTQRDSVEYTERLQFGDEVTRWETRIAPVVFDDSVEYIVGATRDITTRKEREKELRILQHAIDGADAPMTLADPTQDDNPLVYVNDAFEEMTGYSPNEALGDNCRFLQGEDTDSEKVTTLREAIKTEEPVTVELRNYRKDGAMFWNRLTVTPIRDDDGNLVRYLGTQVDITEQKQRERQLTELNQAAQALLTAETKQEIADIGVRAAKEILDLQANAIHLCNTDNTELSPVAQTDELVSLIGNPPPLPVTDSIAGRIYQDGEPVIIDDAQQDRDVHNPGTDLEGHLYLPLGDHGILIAGSEKQAAFNDRELALGELLSGSITAALDRLKHDQIAQRRQKQLSLFFDDSPLGGVQWDENFRFERLNERAKEILGYDESELRGEPWQTIVAEDSQEDIGDVVDRLLANEGGTHAINKNIDKDGNVITCEWHNRAVTDPDGSVASVFSLFQDVSEREKQKKQRREYETIIESLTDAVYVLDETGRFEYVNDEFVDLVGYDRDTILGNTPSLIKDSDTVEEAEQQLGRLLSSDGPDTAKFELTLEPRNGETIICQDHIGVLPYEGDQFNGSVGMLRDITERKERSQELRTIKQQYQTLIENFPDGAVFLFDADLQYVQAGGRELASAGLSSDQVEGATPAELFPEDLAEELSRHYQSTLAGNSHTFEQEYKNQRYRIQTVPVPASDAGPTFGMAVSQNITEQAKRCQELQHRNDQLDRFASIVSHDLRNPLTVADGNLELARDNRDSDHLAKAAEAIDRSQELIEDLLTLSREGEAVDEPEPVALGDIAERSWRTVETDTATLENNGTQTLRADSSRLQQLLENLYRNAVEHGGDDVTVRVGEMADGFYVADTGSGISEANRDQIFEAGYSTATGGSGFGLAIVDQVATAHGWEITVTDSDHGGVRFEITGIAD